MLAKGERNVEETVRTWIAEKGDDGLRVQDQLQK